MNNITPIEANGIPNFFEIPGFIRYVISRDGRVYNRISDTFLEGSINPAGYHNFRITNDDGLAETWGLHRLLGFVFLNPGCSITRLVVNHKDGDKGNNDLENLEWTTYQGNVEHAGANGLSVTCLPLSVRNVDTGEVTHYASFIAYSRECGISKDAVSYRVAIGEQRVFPERRQYRLKDLDKEWFIPENIELSLLENTTWKMVLVKFLSENKIMEFYKASDAAAYLKIAASTMTMWLNMPGQLVNPGLVQVKYATDQTPWRVVDNPVGELEQRGCRTGVYVTNAVSKEVTSFISAKECAEAMNIKTTTLNYRLKYPGKVYSDGFHYAYRVIKSK